MTVEQVEAGLGRCDTDWNEDPHRALSVIEVRRDWVERLGGEVCKSLTIQTDLHQDNSITLNPIIVVRKKNVRDKSGV